jgi:uncharacterized protein (DUF433 family)
MPAAKKSAIHEAARELGRYIVADPKICHGKPTFRGTRILVDSILEMVAGGMPWDRIVWEWDGKVLTEAIAEAVSLTRDAPNLVPTGALGLFSVIRPCVSSAPLCLCVKTKLSTNE